MGKTTLRLAILGVFLMLGVTVVSIEAQEQPANAQKPNQSRKTDWQIFSPPDKSFSVEVPGKPYHTKNPDPGPNGVDDKWFFDLFKCTKKVDFYVSPLASIPNSETDTFLIGIFDVSRCKRKPRLVDKEVDGLFLLIGGDDKEIIEDTSSKVNGRSRREIIYRKGDKNGGRFLAIDAGKRIYWLFCATETMNNDTPTKIKINRIFKSFRLK